MTFRHNIGPWVHWRILILTSNLVYFQQNNLAFKYPSIVHQMEETLRMYKATEVPPGNKPIDPRADPKYYDYTWTNWMDIVDPKTEVQLLTEENTRQYFYSQKKLYSEAEEPGDVEIVVV